MEFDGLFEGLFMYRFFRFPHLFRCIDQGFDPLDAGSPFSDVIGGRTQRFQGIDHLGEDGDIGQEIRGVEGKGSRQHQPSAVIQHTADRQDAQGFGYRRCQVPASVGLVLDGVEQLIFVLESFELVFFCVESFHYAHAAQGFFDGAEDVPQFFLHKGGDPFEGPADPSDHQAGDGQEEQQEEG